MALLLGGGVSTARASGPYVFCNRGYSAYDTCVDPNPHVFYEVDTQSNDSFYNQVCASQRSGPSVDSPLQYAYACGAGTPGIINYGGLTGYATAHNHQSSGQNMEGLFYL